ncbi:MAG: hypothetical protein QHH06_13255 [Clostridiales bacterium]|jgi:hypothetical protein|nr:hypothetical protein [Eubacteriales bacterium]MDH7567411.1 hypothetical protein [Clostridiales bacterium]
MLFEFSDIHNYMTWFEKNMIPGCLILVCLVTMFILLLKLSDSQRKERLIQEYRRQFAERNNKRGPV